MGKWLIGKRPNYWADFDALWHTNYILVWDVTPRIFFGQNLKIFCQHLKGFSQYLRFWPKSQSFGENPQGFGQKISNFFPGPDRTLWAGTGADDAQMGRIRGPDDPQAENLRHMRILMTTDAPYERHPRALLGSDPSPTNFSDFGFCAKK